MSPTPTPAPMPDHGSLDVTSPADADAVQRVVDAVGAAQGTGEPGALDAALASVPRTVFGIEYIPDTGVVVTASPWVIAVTLAAGVVGGVIVARRRARRSDEPSARAQFVAERERARQAARERELSERIAAKSAATAEDVTP